jgi:hypothetical protein
LCISYLHSSWREDGIEYVHHESPGRDNKSSDNPTTESETINLVIPVEKEEEQKLDISRPLMDMIRRRERKRYLSGMELVSYNDLKRNYFGFPVDEVFLQASLRQMVKDGLIEEPIHHYYRIREKDKKFQNR